MTENSTNFVPKRNCKVVGHTWPYRPSVFSNDPVVPGTDVCTACGTTRIINEHGDRQYIYPKADA